MIKFLPSSKGILYLFLCLTLVPLQSLFAVDIAQPQKKYFYLLPTPLTSEAKIFSTALHYGWVALCNTGKYYAYFNVVGPIAGSLILMTDIPFFVGGLTMQSISELELRTRIKDYHLLKDLSIIPSLKTLELLSFSQTTLAGPVAQSRKTQRLIGIVTEQKLPEIEELFKKGWNVHWGIPIQVENMAETRLKIQLKHADKLSETEWNPSLEEIYNHSPIPNEIAEAWRSNLGIWAPKVWSKEWLMNSLTGASDRSLKLMGTISLENNMSLELGSFAEGSPVRGLLRDGMWGKLIDKPLRWLKSKTGKPVEKYLPHTSIKVISQKQKTCLNFFQSLIGRVTFAKSP